MKYVLIVGDGMADHPNPDLNNQTPLQAANIPTMDKLAQKGVTGLAHTLVDGLPFGSDVANLAVLGYDPNKYFSGRAPLEAANIGVELGPKDIAFRCNLVNVKNNIMDDYSAGHITTEDAKPLIKMLNQKLGSDKIRFYLGTSYRHLVVWKNGPIKAKCTPPHDISGKEITEYLPKGSGHKELVQLMEDSQLLLMGHEVNRERRAEGKKTASMIWLWGQGTKPEMPTITEKYNIQGSVISAVDLVKGIGLYAGLSVVKVPGATGYLDTNYTGKAEAALKALKNQDFVFVHVEAPDECGHNGDVKGKVQAIEDLDEKIVKPICQGLEDRDYRMMVMPDHPTPLDVMTHTNEPVPFIVYDSVNERDSGVSGYSEEQGRQANINVEHGWHLMDLLMTGRMPDQA